MAYGIPDRRRAPSARAFDFGTKDFKRDPATGRYLSMHWVDAAMWFYLRTDLGSVRSAPQLGNGVRQIRYITRNTTANTVQDRVLSAIQPLLARNLVRVLSIPIDLRIRGTILYECNYVNLVTGDAKSTPQLPFQS